MRATVLLLLAGLLLPVSLCPAALQYLDDEGEGDFNLKGALTVKDAARLTAQLAFNVQPDTKAEYLLTIKQGVASLALVTGAQRTALGVPVPLALKSGATIPVTLQRRNWRIALVCDGQVVLRAYDSRLHDGKVGTSVTEGAFSDLRIQPVGEMIAQDDFVREEGAQSIWQPILGNWDARSLRDDPQATREEGDKSANAFSYFGSGGPRAITIAGNWFWDRYGAECAVKPMGKGAVGVIVYYQDDKNYLVARWSSLADAPPHGNKLQLVAMRNGEEKVLAEREGGYEPGQWYKLRAQACDGVVQCVVDDEVRLDTQTDLFGQGQMGLYVEGKAGAFFDDVVCNEWDLFRENFTKPVPGKWRGAGWTPRNGVMTYAGKGRSLCATGSAWERYVVTSEVTVPKSGAGLAACYAGPKSYCVVRVAPVGAAVPYAGKAQLVQFSDEGGAVLAEEAFKSTTTKHTLRISVEDGVLTGTVDEDLRLQALSPGTTGGAIALYADGPCTFDNVRLALLPLRKGAHVTKEFTESDKHPEMGEWASTKAPWVPPAEGKDEWWSKGDYFGSTSVAFTVPTVGAKTGTACAVLGTEPGGKPGVALTVAATEKSKQLVLTLTAADQELKKTTVDVEGDANILFSRESRLIVVRVNDAPVLSVAR